MLAGAATTSAAGLVVLPIVRRRAANKGFLEGVAFGRPPGDPPAPELRLVRGVK
ncbi:hypothetical protein ABZ793_34595 [Micromonospora sp. NPDC047465]|uniref:hypothetical protein n=1 Tax=Micromonospora sp. NPDC047465 TaxID=3154813 RepID=UPI0033E8B9AC